MELTAPEIARLLNVSEKQIYRWADDGEIPTYSVAGQPRFHRDEVLEWATVRHLQVSPELFASIGGEAVLPSLAEAIAFGGVQLDVVGADRAAVLSAAIRALPLPEGTDRAFLEQMVLAREASASTAIGRGLAIPHVRSPVVLAQSPALMAVCYLQQPIAYASPDGQPVHTLFLVVSPTVRVHLQLLAKLSVALHDEQFRSAVARRADREQLVAAATRIDAGAIEKRDAP